MSGNSGSEASAPLGRVLIVAGSDCSGGAGVQADIKTVTALGGYAASAVTALTVQNTLGVSGVVATEARVVAAQMDAVFSDIGVDVMKTGMLGDKTLIEAVAETRSERGVRSVVDPVMVSTSGDRLLGEDVVDAVRALMVSGADLVTPNAPEAEVLTGKAVETVDGQRRAAERLLEGGAKAALVKGGHVAAYDRETVIVDVLATHDGEHLLEVQRVDTNSAHGTGCTLASGIATGLARGLELLDAVKLAQAYLGEALRCAPGLGQGHGPVDHGWPARNPEKYADMLNPFRAADKVG